jgi:hypothetical protein
VEHLTPVNKFSLIIYVDNFIYFLFFQKMKLKLLRLITGLGLFASALMLLPQGAFAQGANSSFLPKQITNIFGLLGEDGGLTAVFITGRVRVGLIIALAALILIAVVYALIAAFKYIQSQGDPGKIEEAQKAIKAIFLGIAAMMIGIVGIVLVFVFFSASRPSAELYQVCLSAPNSDGCRVCMESGSDGSNQCWLCEEEYRTGGGVPTSEACKEPNRN